MSRIFAIESEIEGGLSSPAHYSGISSLLTAGGSLAGVPPLLFLMGEVPMYGFLRAMYPCTVSYERGTPVLFLMSEVPLYCSL